MATKATTKKKKQKNVRKPRRTTVLLIALIAVTLAFGWMNLTALTVHVRRAEVALVDLPERFDGTTVLFVSDPDLLGPFAEARTRRLFSRLQSLQPDLLLLGGDYASVSLLERLNGADLERAQAARAAFFRSVAGFQAPLGKFAVSARDDGDAKALEAAMAGSGVELIDGQARRLLRGGDVLTVVGLGAQSSDIGAVAGSLGQNACVVALCHAPEAVLTARVNEASGGGAWCDLILTGHTHGGQARLFGRSALSATDADRRFPTGWSTEGASPVLVSQGLGCEGVELRLGTSSEVWLITLRRP